MNQYVILLKDAIGIQGYIKYQKSNAKDTDYQVTPLHQRLQCSVPVLLCISTKALVKAEDMVLINSIKLHTAKMYLRKMRIYFKPTLSM